MSERLRRFLLEEDGAHLLEYSLLIVGLSTALLEPFLFSAAYYRLTDLVSLMMWQVRGLF